MAIEIDITTTFLGNQDTPDSYEGKAGNVLQVKDDETGIEFVSLAPPAESTGTIFYADLVTTDELPPNTYNNGTGGIGATITADSNGTIPNQDATEVLIGMVLCVRNETSQIKNGLYVVTDTGSVSTPFVLTRIDGYNETSEVYPSTVFIMAGVAFIRKYFIQTRETPVIGIDAISFAQTPAPTIVNIEPYFLDTVSTVNITGTYASSDNVTFPAANATITGNSPGALGSINGVTMTSGKRVLLTAQTDARQNGPYVCVQPGTGSIAFILRRIDYSDANMNAKYREYVIANILSVFYGSRFSLSSPYNLINTDIGISGNLEYDITNPYRNGSIIIDGVVVAGYFERVAGNNHTFSSTTSSPTDKAFAITTINFGSFVFYVLNSGDFFFGNNASGRVLESNISNREIVDSITGRRIIFRSLGDFSPGTVTATDGEDNYIMAASYQNGATGKVVGIAAYNGSTWRSMLEAANRATGQKLYLDLVKNEGYVRMPAEEYADNATAVAALGANVFYYRTGHGLDITR